MGGIVGFHHGHFVALDPVVTGMCDRIDRRGSSSTHVAGRLVACAVRGSGDWQYHRWNDLMFQAWLEVN